MHVSICEDEKVRDIITEVKGVLLLILNHSLVRLRVLLPENMNHFFQLKT